MSLDQFAKLKLPNAQWLKSNDNQSLLLKIFIAIQVLLFSILSLNCFLADSEIWSVTIARQLFNPESFNFSVYTKPLFHFVLKLLYPIPGDNSSLLVNARFLFLLNAWLLLFLLYKVCHQIFKSKQIALLSIFLLFSCQYFFVRGFRVRADLLSATGNLVSLFLIVKIYYETKLNKQIIYSCLNLLFVGLTILATPKAYYFLMGQFLLIILLSFSGELKNRHRFLIVSTAPFVIVSLIANFFILLINHNLIFTGMKLNAALHSGYEIAESFYRRSFQSPSYIGKSHFIVNYLTSWSRIEYLTALFKTNLHFSFAFFIAPFIVLGLNIYNKSIRFGLSPKSCFLIYALFMFVCVFAHNNIYPFFLASQLPILSVLAAYFTYRLLNLSIKSQNFQDMAFIGITGICVVLSLQLFIKNMSQNTNHEQLNLIRYAEKYMKDNNISTFYDVIGSMPKDNKIYKFTGPDQYQQNLKAARWAMETKPQLVLYTSKARYLEPVITLELKEKYAHLGMGAYALGKVIDLQKNEGLKIKQQTIKGEKYHRIPIAQLHEIAKKQFPDTKRFYLYPGVNSIVINDTIFFYKGEFDQNSELVDSNLSFIDANESHKYVYFTNLAELLTLSPYPPFEAPVSKEIMYLFSYDSNY